MKDKKIVALVIEARMTSSRLPGKVLLPAAGFSLFEHLIFRLKKVNNADKIILATTTNPTDDILVQKAQEIGVEVFRGSESNVTDRVIKASRQVGADLIVEITADNPIIDHMVIEQVINTYLYNDFDYVSNDLVNTYPVGMNTRIFSLELLEKSFNNSSDPYEQEHVTYSILKNKEHLKLGNLYALSCQYMPSLELTVDEKEDYEIVKKIIENLFSIDTTFSVSKIIKYIQQNPEVALINQKTKRTNWKK